MMAAAAIIERDPAAKITIVEKNSRMGEKVRRTGGGRCNLTTGLTDMTEILRRYPRGANFLKRAMYSFPPWEVMKWFESHGVPLKTEPDNRVFPQSDQSDDVVAVFERVLAHPNVQILFGCSAEKISLLKNPRLTKAGMSALGRAGAVPTGNQFILKIQSLQSGIVNQKSKIKNRSLSIVCSSPPAANRESPKTAATPSPPPSATRSPRSPPASARSSSASPG